MPKLIKRIVDAAELRDEPYFITCSELPGFMVRVFPSGTRTYYVDYYNKDGIRRRMSIGRHGKLTTEEARKQAVAIMGDALKGGDAAGERATRRNSITMKELCDDYLGAVDKGLIMGKRGKPKKASTIISDRGRIKRHIIPLLGKKLVRDLTRVDINRFIRDVSTGKTATVEKTDKKRGKAVVEGGRGTAARTAGLLGGILTYAVSEGVIEDNPSRGVKRPADNSRERHLTPEEYRKLGRALEQAEADGEIEQAIKGIWLVAFTGFRIGEVKELMWSEVDIAGRCIRLDDSKEDASVRPIGQATIDLLESITRKRGGKYVLPPVRKPDGAYGGLDGAWDRIIARTDMTDVTPHTVRHSYSTVANELGYTEATVAALIGHAKGSVTSRYIHHRDTVLAAAADKVVEHIHSMMIGKT